MAADTGRPSSGNAADRFGPQFWDAYAARYDAVAGLKPYQQMMADILAALDMEDGVTVLDFGCGTGNLERAAAALPIRTRITGVDASRAMLARAVHKVPKEAPIVFLYGDTPHAAGLPNANCDRIVTSNVLFALADPTATLTELRDLLKADGVMVHTTPRPHFSPLALLRVHFRALRGVGDVIGTLRILPALLWLVAMNVQIIQASRRKQTYFTEAALTDLITRSGLIPTEVSTTYGDQSWLLRCVKW